MTIDDFPMSPVDSRCDLVEDCPSTIIESRRQTVDDRPVDIDSERTRIVNKYPMSPVSEDEEQGYEHPKTLPRNIYLLNNEFSNRCHHNLQNA